MYSIPAFLIFALVTAGALALNNSQILEVLK